MVVIGLAVKDLEKKGVRSRRSAVCLDQDVCAAEVMAVERDVCASAGRSSIGIPVVNRAADSVLYVSAVSFFNIARVAVD